MRKIYCIGETVYDIIFKNDIPEAAKAGGSMLNSAVSMGRTKLPVHFISEYGRDRIGNQIDSFLKSNNVNTDSVYRYKDGKTSIAIAFLNEKNDATYSFYKELPSKRLDISFPNPQNGDIVLFGSFYSINQEIRKIVKDFILKAKKNGAIIFYDPNFRKAHLHELEGLMPMIIENMQMASLVRASNEDCEMIFGCKNFTDSYSQISSHCPNLIYTMNSHGVYFKTHEKEISVNVKKIEPLSTIGAGDNFNAGLIYSFLTEPIHEDFNSVSDEKWMKAIQAGIDFASEVCLSYDNYISLNFAENRLNS